MSFACPGDVACGSEEHMEPLLHMRPASISPKFQRPGKRRDPLRLGKVLAAEPHPPHRALFPGTHGHSQISYWESSRGIFMPLLLLRQVDKCCVTQLVVAMTKIPDPDNLEEKRFILMHSLRGLRPRLAGTLLWA